MYFGRIFDEINNASLCPDDTHRIDDCSPSFSLVVNSFGVLLSTFWWDIIDVLELDL